MSVSQHRNRRQNHVVTMANKYFKHTARLQLVNDTNQTQPGFISQSITLLLYKFRQTESQKIILYSGLYWGENFSQIKRNHLNGGCLKTLSPNRKK